MSHQDLKDWLDLDLVDEEEVTVVTESPPTDQTDKNQAQSITKEPIDSIDGKSATEVQNNNPVKHTKKSVKQTDTPEKQTVSDTHIDDAANIHTSNKQVDADTADIPSTDDAEEDQPLDIIIESVMEIPPIETDVQGTLNGDNEITENKIFVKNDTGKSSDDVIESSDDLTEDGVINITSTWHPQESLQDTGDLGDRLLQADVIDASILTQARTIAKQSAGKQLVDIFISMGLPEEAVRKVQAEVTGLPFERIDIDNIDSMLLNRLGIEYCKTNQVIPLRISGNRVVLGLTNPQNLFMIDEVRSRLGKPVKVVLITSVDITLIIDSFTEEDESDLVVDDIIKDIQEDDVEVVETGSDNLDMDLEKQAGESPVIRFVNYLIGDAVRNGASDIHIEPQEKKLRIRYRIDGILFEAMNPPASMHSAMVSRLKIMANLDISERRLPQDGRIRAVVHGRKLDLRVSTLPTGQGEKAVLRILDSRSIKVTLNDLGMPENTKTIWSNQIKQPHGILLVTGPTGSGKSTTLYASLSQMDRGKLNISTVEDPIEYHLDSINQVQVHEKIGMTFASALRSLLRQDPDVIMLGEIRDEETGRIAVQAALTGHLVLSTLHTNDAPSSITRLINIGIEPFLIGAALNGILAQRLVRRICSSCKTQVTPTDEIAEHLELLGLTTGDVYEGEGCEKCRNTGYAGRVGLYEILILDDVLRDEIARKPNVSEFRRLCVERGMQTLRVDGFNKVAEGLTTIEEVLRVTHSSI